MKTLPSEIGQAKVLEYLVLSDQHEPTGNTRHEITGEHIDQFHGLAICKYQDDPGYYLFYCDENWIERTDTYHDSLEEAKEQAEFEYKGTISDCQQT